uniref:peptidoglycan binding protein CsiV n=2 Tax=Thaumasiovibrio subtropicus TaxID=1891207 RepID=UPI000B360394|nr:peptidoglycan binding protein CsiV [Thaumasiovibrio subtropicus]
MFKKMILVIGMLASTSAMARQFDIEVILFKRNIQPEATSEMWPEELPVIQYQNAIDINDRTAMSSHGAGQLGSGSKYLRRQYEALESHAGFTPLAHMVWRQGDRGKRTAPVLHVQQGQDFSTQYYDNGLSRAANPNLGESGGSFITIDTADFNDPSLPQLEGKIQVYVQHYLFIETQLDLRIPSRKEIVVGSQIGTDSPIATPNNAEGIDLDPSLVSLDDAASGLNHLQRVERQVEIQDYLKTYRMDQRRRMRSGETHYLDHPLMGMIIQVRRVG